MEINKKLTGHSSEQTRKWIKIIFFTFTTRLEKKKKKEKDNEKP